MTQQQDPGPDEVFKIIRGNPSDEELAAVLSVLAARAGRAPEQPESPRSGWAAYWRSVRAPLQPGPGNWQAAIRGW